MSRCGECKLGCNEEGALYCEENLGYEQCIDRLQDALYAADRPQEWIPCSKKAPEEDGEYLITLDFKWGREIEIGLYADGEWCNNNSHVNIAWMPLIEPWKGADDETEMS